MNKKELEEFNEAVETIKTFISDGKVTTSYFYQDSWGQHIETEVVDEVHISKRFDLYGSFPSGNYWNPWRSKKPLKTEDDIKRELQKHLDEL